MRRLSLLAALFVIALSGYVQAQVVSIYGTYSPTRVTGVQTGSVYNPPSGYQNEYTTVWANGFGGGVTLNFLPLPVISLGLDLRGSTRPGTVGADTALAGIKLGVHPPIIRIKPYIQASAGYLATRTVNQSTGLAGTTFTNKYAVYEVLGGIDYPLVPFLDLRLIEIGAGQVILNNSNNPNLLTINTGLVLHF